MKKNLKVMISALALVTFVGNSTLAYAGTTKNTGLRINAETNVLASRNRASFKGVKGQGKLYIKTNGATSAKLYVNGNPIDISQVIANGEGTVDVSQYTIDGYNDVKFVEVLPQGANVEVNAYGTTVTESGDVINEFSKDKLKYLDEFITKETKGVNPITGEDMIASKKVQAGFPGAVLTVVKDGQIVKSSAYGSKQVWNKNDLIPEDKREPMTEDTIFDLASNSKMYSTNLALMKLVYEGKLDLDSKVQQYLPEYKDAPDAKIKGKDTITVRHLLHHCAGHASSIRFYEESAGDFYSHDREKTIGLLSKVPLTYEVGSKTLYSDTDYMILGYIVEQITGQRQDKYVEENIYKPLGLKNTCYRPLDKGFKKEQFAATERNGNTRDGGRNYPDIRTETVRGEVHDEKAFYCMGGVSGHAGLFSTGKDLAVLTQLILNGGTYGNVTLFNKETLDEFVKPSFYGADWGLGWNSQDGKRSRDWMFSPYTYNTIGHTGWTGTLTSIDFENNMAVILLTNERNTPCPKEKFEAELNYQTGRYGSITTLVYESLLENRGVKESKNGETLTNVVQGGGSQAGFTFPNNSSSSRPLVNDRQGFYGYEGRGYLVIQNQGVTNAEVYVNGHKINIGDLSSYNGDGKKVDIGAYTVDGINTLKILNIEPANDKNAKINVKVLYPELTKAEQNLSRFNTIDTIINSEVKHGIGGAALAVVNNGKLIKDSYYGKAEQGKLVPLGNGTEGFSTALAIEKLVSDNLIAYTDSVSKHIPGASDSITIKDLLEHQSGLPEKLAVNPMSDRSSTLNAIVSATPEIAVGSKVRYSEYDSLILGAIIEKVSNEAQDAYVEKNIYIPLGLKNTMYNPVAKGIDPSKVQEVEKDYTAQNLNGVSGISGLYSTVEDLAVLSQMVLNYGGYGSAKLINKDQIQYMVSSADYNPQQGLGFIRQGQNRNIESLGAYGSSKTVGFESNTGVSVALDMERGTATVFSAMDRGNSFISSRSGNLMSLANEALNEVGEDDYSTLRQLTKDSIYRANKENTEENRKAAVALVEALIAKEGNEVAKPMVDEMAPSEEKNYLLSIVAPKVDDKTPETPKEDVTTGENQTSESTNNPEKLPQTGYPIDTNALVLAGLTIAMGGTIVFLKNKKNIG